MKSLPKVNPDASLPTWNPTELNDQPTAHSQNARKEKVLAIFQYENEMNTDQKGQAEKAGLCPKGTGKKYTAWQPGLLSQPPDIINKDAWAFIEVSDTPFDKSWKVQKRPDFSSNEATQQENEALNILQQARLQAEEIILAAQAEVDDVLLQAQSEIDEQKKEGYQHGRNEARAEIVDTVKALRIMAEEIETWKAELLSQSEPILVEMLKDISRKMFGDGVKLDSQALHSNLNRIMENAHGLGALKIFINPNDARLLDPSWDEQQMLSLGEQVKIIPSSNVLPGGCLIKGNIGTVDARVETQLNAVLKTFDETDTSGI